MNLSDSKKFLFSHGDPTIQSRARAVIEDLEAQVAKKQGRINELKDQLEAGGGSAATLEDGPPDIPNYLADNRIGLTRGGLDLVSAGETTAIIVPVIAPVTLGKGEMFAEDDETDTVEVFYEALEVTTLGTLTDMDASLLGVEDAVALREQVLSLFPTFDLGDNSALTIIEFVVIPAGEVEADDEDLPF